jgi:hypothetical protein
MIEAVGAPTRYLPGRCALRETGAMLLQVSIQDQNYARSVISFSAISRSLSSVNAIAESLCRVTDIDFSRDTAPTMRTLALWRKNFFEHLAAVRKLDLANNLSACGNLVQLRRVSANSGDVQLLLTSPAAGGTLSHQLE